MDSAVILGVDVAAVAAIPDRDPGRHGPEPTTLPPIKTKGNAFHGASSTKLYRMHGLGYSAEKIACILGHPPRQISDFLRRITAVDGTLLAKPRTRKEQRQFDRERKRAARKAAAKVTSKAIARAPTWPRISDAECDPPPELVRHDRVVIAAEPINVSPAMPPAVTPWVGSSSFQERRGKPKLSPETQHEIQELRALGWSTYDLAKTFCVARNTICKALAGYPPSPLSK